MHLGATALFATAASAPDAERDRTRAARTGSSLGTSRHPSNLTVTIGHLRDARARADRVSRSNRLVLVLGEFVFLGGVLPPEDEAFARKITASTKRGGGAIRKRRLARSGDGASKQRQADPKLPPPEGSRK